MAETDERLDKVERRLGSMETGLGELRGEVGGLRGEVNGLRILGEKNTEDIRKIAEVQVHHGQKLEEIVQALAPMKEIGDFVRRVAPNHEVRIEELEKRTGIRQ